MATRVKASVDAIKNWILDPEGDYEEAGYKGYKLVSSDEHIVYDEH